MKIFLLVNFTLTRNSQLNLDDRLNPSDYAANSKITETKKAPLFEKCFFVTATGFKPVTG